MHYPYITATLFTMYLEGAKLPIGNKVVFTTNKFTETRDTLRVQGISDISNENNTIITEFRLSQNYPNPFNPTTTINFTIPHKAKVILEIYNVLGQKIRTMINANLDRGLHEAQWNSKNDAGNLLGSGVYFYRIKAGKYVAAKKMILLK
jgi:flagellar hook assembly protein FlgD